MTFRPLVSMEGKYKSFKSKEGMTIVFVIHTEANKKDASKHWDIIEKYQNQEVCINILRGVK